MKSRNILYRFVALSGMCFFLASCSNKPVIDPKGVDMKLYEQDLAECEEVSEQLSTTKSALKSGAVGALIGGAFGAIVGDSSVAVVGGTQGAAAGALSTESEKIHVTKNCLRERGYKVLN